MKKLDKLLIKKFIGPFLLVFMIAVIALVMQVLWVYIDDIIGKGVSILMMIELIFYLSISLFPMALSLAVLISSVMVMGDLAEHYELVSLKSAGIPLIRVIMPLAFLATLIAAFSFFCSNNLIPIANLQFKSRLHDIRRQKPTLSLDQGVFNNDFQGFNIYIGKKGKDGRSIEDILIYNQEDISNRINLISASKGEMYISDNNRYFIMHLFDGMQSQEVNKTNQKDKRKYAFTRTNFKTYKKVFDLSEFEINETSKDLFKSHQSMLSARQLNVAIDSLDLRILDRYQKLEKHLLQYFYFEKKRDTIYNKPKTVIQDIPIDSVKYAKVDSLKRLRAKQDSLKRAAEKLIPKKEKKKPQIAAISPSKKEDKSISRKERDKRERHQLQLQSNKIPKQKVVENIKDFANFGATFRQLEEKQLYSKARSMAKSIGSNTQSTLRILKREKEVRVRHIYELHRKFSFAAICIIFLFIGAPMGAIVRKGGFGYPMIISIFFFITFLMTAIMFEKLARGFVLDPIVAAWLPCLILVPAGAILTKKAMDDAKVINLEPYKRFFKRFDWIVRFFRYFLGA